LITGGALVAGACVFGLKIFVFILRTSIVQKIVFGLIKIILGEALPAGSLQIVLGLRLLC
jgi:predicted alternative tryptophan synthase beta-subunit